MLTRQQLDAMRESDAATRAHFRREGWLATLCVVAGIAAIAFLEQPKPCRDVSQIFGGAACSQSARRCPNCDAELPATPCWCPKCKLVYASPGPPYTGCTPPATKEQPKTKLALGE